MKHIIKNIVKVESIEAYHLQHSDIVKGRGVLLNVPQMFSEIEKFGMAEVVETDRIENNTRIYTTKIQLFRCEKLDPEDKQLCFRVTTVSGSEFLVGTSERPYPVITNDDNFPSDMFGRSGCKTTITYESTHPMLSILD